MYRVNFITTLLALLFFTFSATAVETSVNGKLKDECAYLEQTIEETVGEMPNYDNGNGQLGTSIITESLSRLIAVYKELCD